jgi:hypothetical protein
MVHPLPRAMSTKLCFLILYENIQFYLLLLACRSFSLSLLLSLPYAPNCRVDLHTLMKILQYQKALTHNTSLSLSTTITPSLNNNNTQTTKVNPSSSYRFLFIHYNDSWTTLGQNLGVKTLNTKTLGV